MRGGLSGQCPAVKYVVGQWKVLRQACSKPGASCLGTDSLIGHQSYSKGALVAGSVEDLCESFQKQGP